MARSKRKLLKKRRTRRYKKQKGGNKFKLLTPLVGGLGNRLYEIIAGIGFAEKWNMEHVINKKKVEASDHLNEDSSLNDIKQLIPSINIINEDIDYSSWATLNEKTEDGKKYCKLDNPNNNCVLYGFFQHEKYFIQYYYSLA